VSDAQRLEEQPLENLLGELRLRQAGSEPAAAAPGPLSNLDTTTIANAIKVGQKVIYGTDDRVDVFQLGPGQDFDDADSVVALFNDRSIDDNGDGTSTLQTARYGDANSLCPGERFEDQPVGAFCSGFLVAPDVIATAGHCVDASNVTDRRFVFGYRMTDDDNAQTTVDNGEIYSGTSVIGRQLVSTGADWALVRLDRPVSGHPSVSVRRSGRIPNKQAVHVIGHPSGLPTKFADGANVRDNTPAAFFVANLDTYGGNSGSPVFNRTTHEVEGILVRGDTDFVANGDCMISLVCPTTGCRGEDVTRTTEFAELVPVNGVIPDPLLRRGSRGAQVIRLQQALVNLGFNPGPVDGIFGPLTEAGVRAYQTARGLGVDGVVGPKTWGALHADGQ
jgi:hypothetical protein